MRLLFSKSFPHTIVGLFAATLTAGALVGCAATPTSARSGGGSPIQRAAETPVDHDAYATLGYRLAWRGFAVMSRGASLRFFNVFGDTVVAQDSRAAITAMEASNGGNRWSTTVSEPLTEFVGNVRRGNQLLASSDNELFILDIETGEIVDRQNLEMVVNTRPAVVGDLVVYGTSIGRVLGHDVNIGFTRWAYQLDSAIETEPAVVGAESVGVVSRNGDVIIIDASSGSALLRDRIFDGLSNDPVAGDNAMYVASEDQSIYAFPIQGERRLWRVRTEWALTDQPTLMDGTLYVAVPNDGLWALNAQNGQRIWSAQGVRGRVVGERSGRLIVWNARQRRAVTIDPETGDVLDRVHLPTVEHMRMTDPRDGDLYTATADGVVAKFVPRS